MENSENIDIKKDESKYDFNCKVDTVYQFLESFALINGEFAVVSALERYLDKRKRCIVRYYE